MKNIKKTLIAGIVLGSTFITGALAGTAITAQLSPQIKVVVDGTQKQITDASGKQTSPILYNNTTYLPIRSVANLCGKEVGWDQATQTITLTSGSTSSGGTTSTSYSRTNPAPVGTAQSVIIDNYSATYNISAVVQSTERGASAWNKIKAANMFNDEAEEGYEYILAKIKVSVNSVSDDSSMSLGEYSFTAFSSDNVEYDSVAVVEPDPQFGGQVYAGGTMEGYIAFQVKKTDAAPKIVIGADYRGAGGIWFALQ